MALVEKYFQSFRDENVTVNFSKSDIPLSFELSSEYAYSNDNSLHCKFN